MLRAKRAMEQNERNAREKERKEAELRVNFVLCILSLYKNIFLLGKNQRWIVRCKKTIIIWKRMQIIRVGKIGKRWILENYLSLEVGKRYRIETLIRKRKYGQKARWGIEKIDRFKWRIIQTNYQG